MRISDWSSDVCSSDLVSKTPNAPAPLACGWRSGTFSRLKCAICSRKCTSWSRMGPSAPIVSELRSLGAGAPVLIVDLTPCFLSDVAMVSSPLHEFTIDSGWTLLRTGRSEEHTSELQSLMRISYDVFCLKKKTLTTSNHFFTTTNTTKTRS